MLSAFGGAAFATEPAGQPPRFRIGACDWSIGQGGKIEALDVARQIGLDGVEVSFGPPGGEVQLDGAAGSPGQSEEQQPRRQKQKR